MDVRRPVERICRGIIKRVFGDKCWSFNKMKQVQDRLVFLEQVEEIMDDIRGQCGEIGLAHFTQLLLGCADERSQVYFKKSVKEVSENDQHMAQGCFANCYDISDLVKLLKIRGSPSLVISSSDELKLYLLFCKLRDDVVYGWVDSVLGHIMDMPVITTAAGLNDLINRIAKYTIVLNYLREDLNKALKLSGCLSAIKLTAFCNFLQSQDKTSLLGMTDADAGLIFNTVVEPSTPPETRPSTPSAEYSGVMHMFSSFHDAYIAEASDSGYFSDITDDEFVINHPPSFVKESKSVSFDIFEDKACSSPPSSASSVKRPQSMPVTGTFETERSKPYKVGDMVYVDASYLHSLDNRYPLVEESLFVGPFEVNIIVSNGVYIVEIPPCFNCSSLLPHDALSSTLCYSGTDTERLLLREIRTTLEVDQRRGTALIQYADGSQSTVRLDVLRRAQTLLSTFDAHAM